MALMRRIPAEAGADPKGRDTRISYRWGPVFLIRKLVLNDSSRKQEETTVTGLSITTGMY